jgi:hypothetical protein
MTMVVTPFSGVDLLRPLGTAGGREVAAACRNFSRPDFGGSVPAWDWRPRAALI